MTSLFVNADWSALVPAGSAEAAFGIQPKDAKRRGLLLADEPLDEPVRLASANLVEPEVVAEPIPESKEAAKPANKAAPKPANKGAARKDT